MFDRKHASQRQEYKDLPLNLCQLDIKAAGEGGAFRFKGYGSVWNRVDSYGDTMIKGAFSEVLKSRTPIMLFGHKMDQVPGKYLEAKEDDVGLLLEGELTPNHTLAKDLEASLRHGSITGMSIGGYTKSADWIEEDGQLIGRRVKEFDLYEVSIVSMPAEDAARINASSIKAALEECRSIREVEAYLREGFGFTRAGAESLVERVKSLVLHREGDGTDAPASQLATAIKSLRIPQSLLKG